MRMHLENESRMPSYLRRVRNVVTEAWPSVWKTALWLVKITVLVSLVILFLRTTGIFGWLSNVLSPVFKVAGLPGEAALAYVTGYFVNVYSAIAVMSTLSLDVREVTILSVMVLCSHSMVVETAIQKKTGSSAVRMVVIRTLSAIVLGVVLHWVMPGRVASVVTLPVEHPVSFQVLFIQWFWSTLEVVVKMIVLIFLLTLLQRLLSEFGVIRRIVKIVKPVMLFFGLPAKTAFLWIVANTMGLGYGAAVMIEERDRGKISKEDADCLNHHISISHSNLEDVILLASVGALVWWLLLPRWMMSFFLAWELRFERWLKKRGEAH